MPSKKLKFLSKLALAGVFLYCVDSAVDKNKKEIMSKILKRLPVSVSFSGIEGKIFLGRKCTIRSLNLQSQNSDEFSLTLNSLSCRTSILGLLLGPKYLFKKIEIDGLNGNAKNLPEEVLDWLFRLRNIRMFNSTLVLGNPSLKFKVDFEFLDTGKYGLSPSNLLNGMEAKGNLDGKPFKIMQISRKIDVNEDGNLIDMEQESQKDDIERGTKEMDFKKGQEMKKILFLPLIIKHFLHNVLSCPLNRFEKEFALEVRGDSVFKMFVFFGVPFVIKPASKKLNEIFRERGVIYIKGRMAPGKNYFFKMDFGWKDFYFPRIVSDVARTDQFLVFLQRLFQSKNSFHSRVKVRYRFGQVLESDRPEELMAFAKVTSSIFSVGFDEYFDEGS